MSVDISLARKYAENAALGVGDLLRSGYGDSRTIRQKDGFGSSVVTKYDEDADHKLYELLGSFDQSIGFHGEEHGRRESGSESTYWLVDPIDGTGLYVRGLPGCTCMITLIDNNEVLVAVVYDFVAGDMYTAGLGEGTTRNGEPIHVSDRGLAEAYISFEVNTTIPGNENIRLRLAEQTVPMQNINCGWDYAMIASGRLDGRVMKDPWGAIWDYAPAMLVREAGGVVANVGSHDYDLNNFSFLATNPRVFEELTTGLNAVFPIAQSLVTGYDPVTSSKEVAGAIPREN